ncbi:MAG: ACT domain-containing protein [Oscillospiraceae bacterium]|jgi:chorismate mutase|nr:ACT domain-containing protein [Oscillospiraceae bacterium]
MAAGQASKYFLVEADMLPEIFVKVAKAKELLETGEAQTVAEAAGAVGISRSAFYKYKDAVTPFQDLKRGGIITFHITLRDKMGVLSSVLAVFANSGANILTINQSIPINGTALVTISAETTGMAITGEALLDNLHKTGGVKKAEVLAG